MSWGTTFEAEVFLSRESYDSIYQVESAIEEVRDDIKKARERILMYAAGGCNGVSHNDSDGAPINPIEALYNELNAWLELYDDYNLRLYKLLLLKDDWNEQEKKFNSAELT